MSLAIPARDLSRDFANPPDTAKPWMWWHWMNGNVSRSGITKDLEAIKAAGGGGVILFEESDRIAPGPVRYLSDEHIALIEHAGTECARLGLKFGFQNCPGWSSSGGPWVTPEQAMKHVTWSEHTTTGGKKVSLPLARPSTKVKPFTDLGPPKRYGFHDYYRDIAVIAFPTPKEPNWRLDDWQKKMGYLVGHHLPDQRSATPDGVIIEKNSVVVLSDKMRADGTLEWDAPVGDWTVLRFGYTLTEHQNRESPTTGATGLEIDKLSRDAADFHWQHFVNKVIGAANKSGGSAMDTVMIDSYEPLTQTWTPAMREEFKRLRNYDPAPYYLCLTGRVVGGVDETERFLWDYRRTLADLMAQNYYGRFSENARAQGLSFASEGYGYYGTFFDDFQVATYSDIPMGEFWAGVIKWHHWSGKIAASAADVTGRHIVGVEAFTTGNEMSAWRWHPYTLKAQGDYFLCRGVNRFYFQASAHQPWADHIKPGMTMGPNGIQMNRNNTWFAQSRGWLAHLARSQYLLQQGQLVTDVYYCYGDNAPGTMRPVATVADKGPKGVPWGIDVDVSPDTWTPMPTGRDFHVGNGSVVRQMSVNSRGELTVPAGPSYQVLLLPNDDRMDYTFLQKIAELVEAGATILGPRPIKSPTLSDGNQDARIQTLAAKVWGDIDGKTTTSHRYGKGTVHFGVTLEEILTARGLPRDFEYHAAGQNTQPPRLDYIHRKLEDREFYFVSNQRNEPSSVECIFRTANGEPELWLTETGEIRPATLTRKLADGRTAVTLHLEPAEACFVVFKHTKDSAPTFANFMKDGQVVADAATARLVPVMGGVNVSAFAAGKYAVVDQFGKKRTAQIADLPAAQDLSLDWRISFPPNAGAPAQTTLARLESLTASHEEGVSHFSGTATYRKKFTIAAHALPACRIAELDLGDVQVIAELTVNGEDFGLIWKPPYRRDITRALKIGENTITVKVTTLWRNRLVGDAKIAGFTPVDQARLVDQMLAGHTKVTANDESTGGPHASDDFYPLPDWVRAGKPNPDPRLHTFTTFAFLTNETPLVPSGLIGPVRLVWGQTQPLQ